MKKFIVIRIALSILTVVLVWVIGIFLAPSTTVLSANAALGQMSNSDTKYVESIAGMNIGTMFSGTPGLVLLFALIIIWGSLLLNKRK